MADNNKELPMQVSFYCVKCRKSHPVEREKVNRRVLKNGRHALEAECGGGCGTRVFKIVSAK